MNSNFTFRVKIMQSLRRMSIATATATQQQRQDAEKLPSSIGDPFSSGATGGGEGEERLGLTTSTRVLQYYYKHN